MADLAREAWAAIGTSELTATDGRLRPPLNARWSNVLNGINHSTASACWPAADMALLQTLAQPQLGSAPRTPMRAAATNTSPLQHVSGGGGRGLGCGATKAYVEVAKPKTPPG